MKNAIKNTLTILLCSSLSAVAAVGLYTHYNPGQNHLLSNTNNQTEQQQDFNQPQMQPVSYMSAHTPQDFADVAERSLNGVVNIRSEVTARPQQQYIDPFEFFFGPGFRGQAPQQREQPKQVGIGSGVIISTDGYILTNNHVVADASKLTVTTNDNKEYDAKIIGTDPSTDIALLKIEAKGLHPIPFGDSEALRVGEWVLAIGNPFNLSSTVTAGIVSAKGRSSMGDGSLQIASFIQTDAVVNRGNSGGALVNTKGELVGINTMIFSHTGSYEGYSFAVPVSIARKVVADLQKYGTVQRAVLGVMGTNITSETTKKFDLKATEGALIADFAERSTAKQAGLKEGDVITAVNGTRIRNMAQLQEQISKYRPGDKITLKVDRKGDTKEFSVELKNAQGNTEVVKNISSASIGAAFRPLTTDKKRALGVDYGVEVVGVDKGKFRSAGIDKGFIILSINNIKVQTPEDVDRIVNEVIRTSPDKVLFVKGLYPNGRLKYLAIDLND